MIKTPLSTLLLALLLAAPAIVPAEIIFSNQTKAPASLGKKLVKAKATATQFTLAEPVLITSIKAPQTASNVETDVQILQNGKVVYTERSLMGTPNEVRVHPYMVFAPGVYVVKLTSEASWQRDGKSGAGVVVIEGNKANATEAASAITAFLLTPEGAAKPFSLSEALHNAKLDTANLKQNIKDQTQGLNSEITGAGGKLANELGAGRKTPGGDAPKGPSSGTSKAFEGLQGEGMAPSAYADTYGGQRWNSGRTGSPGNFSGGGKGHASSGDDGLYDTIVGMLNDAGGTVTGDPQTDAAEAAYMMSVGSDGWEATKNMTSDERQSYWQDEQNRQLVGSDVGRPRDDEGTSGPFIIFGNANMRRAMFQFQAKAIEARKGRAGGAESQSGSSGVKMPMGQDGKPVPERNMGTLNWDKIMEINEVINPTRQ